MYGRKNIKCTTNYKKSIKNWGGGGTNRGCRMWSNTI